MILRNKIWWLAGAAAWVTGVIFLAFFGPQSGMPMIGQVLLWTVVPLLIGTGLLIPLFSAGFVVYLGLGVAREANQEIVRGKPDKEATYLLIGLAGAALLIWVFNMLKFPEIFDFLAFFGSLGLSVWLKNNRLNKLPPPPP